MPKPDVAPYGSWRSPITSDLIVAQITQLSDVRIDEDGVYWLEGRPQEQGRNVIVRAALDGTVADITPAGFNVRTRVHEYGGGSWSLAGGTCIFSNFEDQRLYRQHTHGATPDPLTLEAPNPKHHWRYSDGVLDPTRHRWVGVREDHTNEGEPVNTIVAIDVDRQVPRLAACSSRDMISLVRRAFPRTPPACCGSHGIIPTCHGTGRRCTWQR